MLKIRSEKFTALTTHWGLCPILNNNTLPTTAMFKVAADFSWPELFQIVQIMAILVMEFQVRGYKIQNIFAYFWSGSRDSLIFLGCKQPQRPIIFVLVCLWDLYCSCLAVIRQSLDRQGSCQTVIRQSSGSSQIGLKLSFIFNSCHLLV